jgi:bla regulator protein blaR1
VMIPDLVPHLIQSTLFAGVPWLLALALRKNRAHVRFWLYFTASMKFLVPFAVLISIGSLLPKPAAPPSATARWADVVGRFAEYTTVPSIGQASAIGASPEFDWQAAAFALWFCGFAAISACWLLRWRRMRALCISASPVGMAPQFPVPIKSAAGLMEPGVFGISRQVLLLPEGITERLSAEEFGAILAHEWCHVRRRDNLTAAMHMSVQAIFWFHPIVWWLGARMIHERERACDEEVLRLGNRPRVYAAGILNVCRRYVESPLPCVSGVTGSNLKRRLEAILAGRNARKLGYPKIAALTLAAAATVGLPVAIGLMHPRPIRAQTPPQSAPKPRFDVASIKPCQPGDGPGRGGRDAGANRGIDPELPEGVGGYFRASPGRLDVTCASMLTMIDVAYLGHGSPLLNNVSGPMHQGHIAGIPKWALSARYTIHAETEDPVSKGPTKFVPGPGRGYPPAATLLYGTMLQSLLEDRFQLKLHRETEEAALYALTVAKGGLKLRPMLEGDCIPEGPMEWPEGGKPPCGWVGWIVHGPDRVLLGGGITLNRFASELGELIFDRTVIDRTAVSGTYNIRLEYAPDENTHCIGPAQWCQVDPNSEISPGPNIFNALERQYGLKLETIRGPKEHIVVDSVQPPSEN